MLRLALSGDTGAQERIDLVIDGLNMGYWGQRKFQWPDVLAVMDLCEVGRRQRPRV